MKRYIPNWKEMGLTFVLVLALRWMHWHVNRAGSIETDSHPICCGD